MGKKKIAVLGGGTSSLSAVYEITSQPGWQDDYEITVYQMGWRLGGKGASGRNPDNYQRIEEHGLHIWFGFYENAFRLIKRCYDDTNRSPDQPFHHWSEAFHPHSYVVLMEEINGEWIPWKLDMPTDNQVPGEGNSELSLLDMIEKAILWINQIWKDHQHKSVHNIAVAQPEVENEHWWQHLKNKLHNHRTLEVPKSVPEALELLHKFSKVLHRDTRRHDKNDHIVLKGILNHLKKLIGQYADDVLAKDTNLRRLFIMVDLAVASIKGMIEDGVLTKGFDVINDYDLEEWLAKHGASKKWSVQSAPVRAIYDLAFAYQDGDATIPNFEAGTAIRGMMRMGFGYRGAFMWKMQAGMGDTIFSPMYQVLQERGVDFKFFHKVQNLELSDDKSSVGKIRIAKQVNLKNENDGYQPLVSVRGLDCWPSYPLYDQIVEGEKLKENNINLESFWTNWPEIHKEEEIVLEAGKDFDDVILGISVGAFPYVCKELIDANKKFGDMVANVKTVQTQAYQLWMNKNINQLGWEGRSRENEAPVLGTFVEPIDTWADMSHLIIRESWPDNFYPANLSYFCGVLKDESEIPPKTEQDFPAKEKAKVKQHALDMITQNLHWLLPGMGSGNSVDWNLLMDPQNREGKERFDSQFWRANVDPTERYVLSVKNSTKYRLDTDESGFSNVYLTGDWIKTGLNAGCVEASVMAGMQTSRAICGYPKTIVGEEDF